MVQRSGFLRNLRHRLARWVTKRKANAVFEEPEVLLDLLEEKGEGDAVLCTKRGLEILVRRNGWDAEIVREIFLDRPYMKGVQLTDSPTIVDIGGYIGDFTLFAISELCAEKVVVYEPTAENFAMLIKNLDRNGCGDRVVAVNKGVSDKEAMCLNVEILDNEEVHASSIWYHGAEQRSIPCVTMDQLFAEHELDKVDLLKIDCEGGEYDILPAISPELLERIQNIVFEWHETPGYRPKLAGIEEQLSDNGFKVVRNGHVVLATCES